MKKIFKYIMIALMSISMSGCASSRQEQFDHIYGAASHGDSEALIDLLDDGESLNVLNDDNLTPLCYAYIQQNETAIRHLESYGANAGANCYRTKDGRALIRYTPEHNPPQKQYPKVMNNSVITTSILTVAAAVGAYFLIAWL